ncbi:MAG: zf-TFIIB domain-containing protein [Acidobacteria bacterium]|nr:zf-TFIIB domain-containing protein [Acidobacteriota bacterium]
MICPRDGSETVIEEHGDAKVDTCPQCGGMFLHRGELNKVAEPIPGDLEFSTLDLDTFDHPDDRPPIPCPNCDNPQMDKVEFNIESGLILDYCGRCGGFWLDGDELDRINQEVRELNETAREIHDPAWLWVARLLSGITS